jgi:hypothetical protein
MTLQFAEKLASAAGSYQGTTSVVPYDVEKYIWALAPEGISQKRDRIFQQPLQSCRLN